jgi:hypothetical protein
MAGHPVIRHDESILHKWFGPNRTTHWTLAGSIALIILGSYLVYSMRDNTPMAVGIIPMAQQTPAPAAPAAPAPAPPAALESVK